MAGIICLTTDFGLEEEYVGVMKGVIYTIAPHTRFVDLTHNIPRHDIRQAAYIIKSAGDYFPPGTIHLAIVDPGVGSDRAIILVCTEKHMYLAPDNGLLTLIMKEKAPVAIYKVTNKELFLKPVSTTFHGRDIMAPVAARLASGLSPSDVGPTCGIEDTVIMRMPRMVISEDGKLLTGSILHVDHFGNLMSNVSAADLLAFLNAGEDMKMKILLNDRTFTGLHATYNNVPSGSPVAVIGSRNYLEISCNMASAAEYFAASPGDEIKILQQ